MIQAPSNAGLRGPGVVPVGQPVPIDVRTEGVDEIIVDDGTSQTPVPIPPGGKVSLPARPNWTPGTVLTVFTNKSPVRAILIEIVSTAP